MKKIDIHNICPDENELGLFIEGKLKGPLQAIVKKHIEECPVCNEAVRMAMEFRALESVREKEEEVAILRAAHTGHNLCVLYAETYILQSLGIKVIMDDLVNLALSNGWLNKEGVEFRNVGKLLEYHGVEVKHKSGCPVSDIRKELARNHFVIVGVDAGELFAKTKIRRIKEKVEDLFAQRPDHALIVTAISSGDPDNGEITLLNFEKSRPKSYTVSTARFMEAWEDSGNYMVSVKMTKDENR